MLGWKKHKLESRLLGEISDMQMTLPYGGFPGGSEVKASTSNAGDPGSIPGWGFSQDYIGIGCCGMEGDYSS